MYIPFLIIISILSFFSIGETISKWIIKHKKIVSETILILAFLSLFLILTPFTIKESGEIAIGLLWIILWLPILSKVFLLNIPQKLMLFRKEIGIWMGMLSIVHTTLYFKVVSFNTLFSTDFWFLNGTITFLTWGMLAFVIAIILTFTSNNISMKLLGKKWKYLHRTAYLLLIFALLHVAFLKISNEGIIVFITTFIPFIIYFILKILEWKNIKIPTGIK
ncbi:MAG: ferric reductase-like transmembrane domain-containing protein [Candidatus Gracilibacteria bacterium]|nr:ferric reductase-like transmembrane domain-containing protein [Candidatus Gracilibacteria bacterium]